APYKAGLKKNKYNKTQTMLETAKKIINDNTSKEDYIKRSFAMKLFNGELPVMLKRFEHQPHIYNSPKCILCGRYEETDIHVFECKRNNNEESEYTPMTNHYKQLINCLTIKIQKQIDEIEEDKIQSELRSLSELWKFWGDTDEMSSPRITLHELIKGFIPQSLVFKVTS
ncbi:27022_t:CDS:2, partial [Dentiscutata erythropus]